jgi:hypothetical protein
LGSKDLDYSLSLLTEIPKAYLSRGGLYGIGTSIANGDPEEVYSWLRSASSEYPEIRHEVIRKMARVDASFLEEKLKYETDDGMINSMVRFVAEEQMKSNPIATMQLLSGYEDYDFYEGTISQITRRWAHDQPLQMLEFTAENPTEGLYKAVESAVQSLYYRDPQSALTWLDEVEDGEIRQRGLAGIAIQMARVNPQEALALVKSLSDEQAERARFRIAVSWMYKERHRVEEIIAAVDVNVSYEARLKDFAENRL